jgi:phenylacetate-CoA ligase
MAKSHPTRAEIQSSQLEQLLSLLAELIPGNRFYTDKLQGLGITFDVASLEDFSERFPFTTKAEIAADQTSHPPYGTNLTYPVERYTRCHQTSGTTGVPLRWLDTPESWEWMVESWCEVFKAAGVTHSDRIYFAFSFGPFIGFWLAFEAGMRMGGLCLPGGGLSSAARVRALIDHKATVLCCTPTYAIRLAEVAAQEKIDLSSSVVRTIVVAGEPGGSIPTTRQQIEKLWPGAKVFDHHGMTEVGPVTYECPAQPGVLHVIETAYYTEVIDPSNGKPVPDGTEGELVLTTLGRTGSPLLRYRTGDLVKRGTRNSECGSENPCACGRFEMALEGGILGRVDDMVVVRGVNIYPGAVEEVVRGCGGVAEYRVTLSTQRSLPELLIEIEPAPDAGDPSKLIRRVERALQEAFALRILVASVEPGTLPRFELKARRWMKS